MIKLYLVHGNTWYEGYGNEEHVFGIFTDRDTAEAAKKQVIKELYKKEMKSTYTVIDDISEIEVDILEIEADKIADYYLGGYCE